MAKFLFFLLIPLLNIGNSQQYTDTFHEELLLKPLPSGHINSFFQFTTKWHINKNDSRKYLKQKHTQSVALGN